MERNKKEHSFWYEQPDTTISDNLILHMLSSKNVLLAIATIISCSAFGQQSQLLDTLEKRNQRTLKLVLNDADHDGVSDQLDKEPNTPAGCAVDTHGVILDTDEDGVPDCKDKEKLTKKKCFPVDSTGVGSCLKKQVGSLRQQINPGHMNAFYGEHDYSPAANLYSRQPSKPGILNIHVISTRISFYSVRITAFVYCRG